MPFPELDRARDDAESGPVRRPRHGHARESRLDLGDARLEIARVLDRPALLRRPRADLAAARARREVRVRLGVAHRLRGALDAHLHLERLPVEAQRGALRRQQLAPLSALVVRVEDEAALVDVLEQDDANARLRRVASTVPSANAVGSGRTSRGSRVASSRSASNRAIGSSPAAASVIRWRACRSSGCPASRRAP